MKENLCRICGQCFCCKKCRINHEDIKHNVHPECDICVYGRFNLNNPSNSLVEHIKKKHMPVHCLRCKQVFSTTADLTSHDMCVFKIERIENAPDKLDSISEINYDTPPTMANMYKSILMSSKSNYNRGGDVTTSTPMQNNNDRDMMLDNIQEVITPVDAIENHDNVKNLNSGFKIGVTPCITEQSKNGEGPLKRRVTFIETPTEYTTGKRNHSTSSQTSGTSGKQFFSADNLHYKNLSDDYKRCRSNANSSSCNSQNSTYATASDSKHVEILQSPKEEDEFFYVSYTDPVEEDLSWKSALMDSDSSFLTASVNQEMHFRDEVSESSKLFADLLTGDIQYKSTAELEPNVAIAESYFKKEGIWSSMTNLVKTVMHGFTSTENIADPKNVLKRPRSDSDTLMSPVRKKFKLASITGRKPIHELKPSFLRYRRNIQCLDKSTQTD